MPVRQISKEQYFEELALTSRKYFVPYIEQFTSVRAGTRVLEVGCGAGGNLAPLAERGSDVVGVDLFKVNIEAARACFASAGLAGTFAVGDFFAYPVPDEKFDVVFCHDVIEHIADKEGFLRHLSRFVAPDGVIFMSFPAWQMPFGGHQQNCASRLVSHWPWVHLLPRGLYRWVLSAAHEEEGRIAELLDIKETRTPIERFERVASATGYSVVDRRLYFINPHYEVKFGLRPRRLYSWLGRIPWVRNFFTTSCFYLLRVAGEPTS